MKKLIITGFTLLLIFAMAQSAIAQKKPRGGNSDVMKSLNLTAEQQDKIDAFRTKHQKSMVDLRADLQKSMIDQRELLKAGDVQRDKYLAAVEKNNKIREKISLEMANHRMDIYGVLDKEQKAKFEQLREDRGMRKNRGMMRGGRFGFRGKGIGMRDCNGAGQGGGLGTGNMPGCCK